MNLRNAPLGFTLSVVSLFVATASADEVSKNAKSRAMYILVNFTCERLEDEKWVLLDEKEVAWADDILRFTPVLKPDDLSNVKLVRILRRPIDAAEAPWEEFGRSRPSNAFVETSLDSGDWSIDMEVTFNDGTTARLKEAVDP